MGHAEGFAHTLHCARPAVVHHDDLEATLGQCLGAKIPQKLFEALCIRVNRNDHGYQGFLARL
jgi:hypothetical protein